MTVGLLGCELQLHDEAVHLVDDQHWLDVLEPGLAKNRLRLRTEHITGVTRHRPVYRYEPQQMLD